MEKYSMKLYMIVAGIIILILFEIIKRRKNKFNEKQAKELGKLLFADKGAQFEKYVSLYANDKTAFKMTYGEVFDDWGIELKDIKLIDLIISFGEMEEKILIIDWRGEENEGEIQAFCEKILGRSIIWDSVKELKDASRNNAHQLLENINKDLSKINHQLIFMNTSNDSYELTVVSKENLLAIKKNGKGLFRTKM